MCPKDDHSKAKKLNISCPEIESSENKETKKD